MRRPLAQPIAKFFADRGTHLAAMIAYFGLLSSVSLIFLALALLGYTGRAEESSYLVRELQKLFPSQSITDIVKVVDAITSNATTLGLIEKATARFGSSGRTVTQLEAALREGSLFVVREEGLGIVARTSAGPSSGLVLYDLRTCLRAVAATKKKSSKPRSRAAKKPEAADA